MEQSSDLFLTLVLVPCTPLSIFRVPGWAVACRKVIEEVWGATGVRETNTPRGRNTSRNIGFLGTKSRTG